MWITERNWYILQYLYSMKYENYQGCREHHLNIFADLKLCKHFHWNLHLQCLYRLICSLVGFVSIKSCKCYTGTFLHVSWRLSRFLPLFFPHFLLLWELWSLAKIYSWSAIHFLFSSQKHTLVGQCHYFPFYFPPGCEFFLTFWPFLIASPLICVHELASFDPEQQLKIKSLD